MSRKSEGFYLQSRSMALDRDQGCCEVIIRQSSLLLFSDSRVRKTGELERIFFSFKEVHFFAAAAAITKHLPSSSPDICTFAHPTLKTKSLLTQQLLLLLSSAFKGPLRGRGKSQTNGHFQGEERGKKEGRLLE